MDSAQLMENRLDLFGECFRKIPW